MHYMDLNRLSSELVRELRGPLSQAELSEKLGYTTNVLYTWEAGRRAPTASDFFRLVEAAGQDVPSALVRFFVAPPPWLRECRMTGPEDVMQLLAELTSGFSVSGLAETIDASRTTVSRWNQGQSEPRLPDLLRVVEATTGRLLDFVGVFVDPERLDTAREPHRLATERRRLLAEHPLAAALLSALDLDAYKRLRTHRAGVLARRLGIPSDEETTLLAALEKARLVRTSRGRIRRAEADAQDDKAPRRPPPSEAFAALAGLAADRLARSERPEDGFGTSDVVTVSKKNHARLVELERAHDRAVRRILAEEQPAQCVAILTRAVVRLDRDR
jgi:transcriptional regulator with XRE-family HTH domain